MAFVKLFAGLLPDETSLNLISRFAYDGDGNLQFYGRADPGSLTSEAAWFIARYAYDGDGNVTEILHADGDNEFDNVFDDRASLSYS